jgi:type IV pilus assembly protein PilY1
MKYRNTGIKKQSRTNLPFWTAVFLSAFMFFVGSNGSLWAEEPCIDLADEPLEVSSMGAPGMIMFVYDNSGSMAWSLMTNEPNGLFHTPNTSDGYGYLYEEEADYSTTYGDVLQNSADDMRWRTQWGGYNKVYYRPDIAYEPWAGWTQIEHIAHSIPVNAPQADPNTPLLYVVRDAAANTINLGNTWKAVEINGGGDLDDLINTVGIIVDNTDTGVADTIQVDDGDPGFFTSCPIGPNPDNNWEISTFDGIDGDYQYYNGENDDLPAIARWTFNIAAAGEYRVEASVIKNPNNTSKAAYYVTDSSGLSTVISRKQNDGDGQVWIDLGDFDFEAGNGTGIVDLYYLDDKEGDFVTADAVRLIPIATGATNKSCTYSGSPDDWSVNSTSYTDARIGDNYLYTNYAGSYTATWTAENLDPGTDYSAYVRVVSNTSRSEIVYYTVDGTIVEINQRDPANYGKWVLLKDNISFADDTGVVTLNHECSQYNGDSAAADAVAFVPTDLVTNGIPLNIVIAHYYVKNDTGVYLVNLNGNIRYFQLRDAGVDWDGDGDVDADDIIYTFNGDRVVDNGELQGMTLGEAQAAGIITGRSYPQERQNFANWCQFARSRDHVARYAVAKLVEAMGNIYFGLSTVPPTSVYAIRAVKETTVLGAIVPKDDTMLIFDNIYNLPDPHSSTPLKDSFEQVAQYFEGSASLVNAADKAYFVDGGYATSDTYPYLNEDHGGHCQQAFIIAMTDGMYNSNEGKDVGDYDSDCNTVWDCGVYADPDPPVPVDGDIDHYVGTLADIAMDFYERDLKSDDILIDEVPTNQYDQNKEQHMVTYALSFGVTGSLDPDDYPDCPNGINCPDWPVPEEGTLTTIDDMYHATINGRGLFLNASNPQELVDALMKIKQNIEERLGSSSAVTTSSVQRQIGSKLYRGQYMTGRWTGDLEAYEIDSKTGAVLDNDPSTPDILDAVWSAKDKLDASVTANGYASRIIYSSDGSLNGGIPFEYSVLSVDQKTQLANGLSYAFGSIPITADTEDLVNYIRGDVTNDRLHSGPFRARTNLLGDIVHSEAEFYNGILYVGANDGMLHGFRETDGAEVGAYVPNMLYSELGKLSAPDYNHQYFVNGSPFVSDLGSRQLLVCPMSKGYKGLFVLDISAFGIAAAGQVALWEYPAAGVTDLDLGYTYSNATIFKTKAAGWVVITGNGYDSTNGHAVLYIFDAINGGDPIAKLDTGLGLAVDHDWVDCNGLSSPAIIDPDSDGNVDFVYAGDLKGNMWKFDLRSATVADWDIAFYDGSKRMPLVTVTDSLENPQPITTMPGVMFVNKCNPPGSKGFLILFGTGKYMGLTDTTDGSQQSIYAVYDWGPDWEMKGGVEDQARDTDKYLGTLTLGPPRTLSNSSPIVGKDLILVQQTVSVIKKTLGEDTYRFISDNPVTYYNLEADMGEALGWYMDFPDYKERMVRRPVIRNNILVCISNTPEKSVCSAGGTSVLYQVDACSGGWPDSPQFDTDGDGDFDEDDMIGDPIILTDTELMALVGDADGDGDVDMDDVLAVYDTDDSGFIETEERSILQPPVGKEYDTILMDPSLLENVIYLNDLDDVQGEIIPELPIGAWFWNVIE